MVLCWRALGLLCTFPLTSYSVIAFDTQLLVLGIYVERIDDPRYYAQAMQCARVLAPTTPTQLHVRFCACWNGALRVGRGDV